MFDHEFNDSLVSVEVFLRDSPHFISVGFAKVCKKNSASKIEPVKYTVPILKQLLKEHGVRAYSGKRKAELIAILQASNPQSQTLNPKLGSHTLLDELPHHHRYHLGLRNHPRKKIKWLERRKT